MKGIVAHDAQPRPSSSASKRTHCDGRGESVHKGFQSRKIDGVTSMLQHGKVPSARFGSWVLRQCGSASSCDPHSHAG